MARLERTRWVVLGGAYLMAVGAYIAYFGWSPGLTDIVADLSLTYAQAGSLASVTALTGGIALTAGGPLVDRVGPRKVILIALVVAVVGELTNAVAQTYPVVLLARGISGLAVGLLLVAPYTMAIGWFVGDRQAGRATGVMLSADGIGLVFALVLSAMVFAVLGWRGGVLAQAGYLAVLFVVALVLLRDPPTAEAPPDAVPTDAVPTDAVPTDAATRDRYAALRSIPQVLRNRTVLLAMVFFVGAWGVGSIVPAWLPTILVSDAGWSESLAGLFASSASLFGIVTALASAVLAARFAGRRPLVVALSGLAMAAFVGMLAVGIGTADHVLTVVALPLIGLALYLGVPLALALVTETVDGRHIGTATGLVVGSGYLVGGVVYPYLIGDIRDATGGYTTGFAVTAALTVVLCAVPPLFGRDQPAAADSTAPNTPISS